LGLTVWLTVGLTAALTVGLTQGLTYGLMIGLSRTGSYAVSLASVQLAVERRTPMRLMRFLGDAHQRNVLRAVGPSYQFRHARLQDRLAATVSPGASNAAAPAGNASSPLTSGTP
jgi:hypothetical protein